MQTYDGMTPSVHPTAWVHGSAVLIGEVTLGEDSSVWPTCVLRGDNGAIVLGARSNLQDGSIVHATLGVSHTQVGVECTVGHRVVLHGCTIGDGCLVGMGSVLLDGAELGAQCFVGAGALITPRSKFPPGSFILGSPAKRVREVRASELEWISHSWQVYLELARKYRAQQL